MVLSVFVRTTLPRRATNPELYLGKLLGNAEASFMFANEAQCLRRCSRKTMCRENDSGVILRTYFGDT